MSNAIKAIAKTEYPWFLICRKMKSKRVEAAWKRHFSPKSSING